MLAVNETSIDLLSLGCQGQELEVSRTHFSQHNSIYDESETLQSHCFSILHAQILETIPYDKVTIKVISIHLDEYYNSRDSSSFGSGATLNHSSDDYHKKVWRFLESKSYKLVKVIDHNYIYQFVENKSSKKPNFNPNDSK